MLSFSQFVVEDQDLGKRIKKATSSNAAYKILDSHPSTKGSTWQAGGCGVLAHALHKHLPGSKLVDVHNKKTGHIEHVAVHHGEHIYDANGATPTKHFIKKFAKRELKNHEDLELTPHDPKRAAKSEISTHPSLVDKMHKHLSSLKEEEDDDWKSSFRRPIKGWMSPSGKAHLMDHNTEHKDSHHPEYLAHHGKQGDPVQHAQAHGFVRFGGNYSHVHGNYHFVHYDKKHPKGRETAIKALEYMKPHHDDPVTVSGSAGIYDREKGKRNATAMKQLGSSSTVPARHAYELLKKGKSTAPVRPHAA